jgi:hypothetical protein
VDPEADNLEIKLLQHHQAHMAKVMLAALAQTLEIKPMVAVVELVELVLTAAVESQGLVVQD